MLKKNTPKEKHKPTTAVKYVVALNKRYMHKIPSEFMQKKETSYGIAVCKVNIEKGANA